MNFSFQRLTELVDAVSRGAVGLGDAPAGTPQRLWEETRSWVGRFVGNATTKWLPFYVTLAPCHVKHLREGVPFPCTNHAIGRCVSCKGATCLHHAFVDGHGDAICYPCAVRAVSSGFSHQAAPPPGGAPPPMPEAVRAERIKAALKVLGLKPGAPIEQVRKKHRELAAKYHPDRARSAAAKEKAQGACAAVNAAFAELQQLGYGEPKP